ncbi:hypothetical protein D3877_17390 [Azospirillum cavernae]|uniref:Uncharacterized protein n=1 Tax=Azospirillum cavernae TaxID=2320860 RepID=A0A418VXJ0_9PROT|nr:hypothetical protein [Azospirillum cavernae]RJF81872.1 hypothetical protein D3877_17390 [Azospirillum cavernae]
MRAFPATPEVRPEGANVSRRRLLAGAGATAATLTAPIDLIASATVAAPVGVCPARYVGVPPAVVCMGEGWVNEWLTYNDDTREFIETVCRGLAYSPTDERKDDLNDLVNRARLIMDQRTEEAIRPEGTPELIREGDAMTMAVNVLDEGGGMAALNYAITSLRTVRRRWDEDEFAKGNLNALVLSLSLVGVLLTGLGHPDFGDDPEGRQEGAAA